jgi:hypothetical protein
VVVKSVRHFSTKLVGDARFHNLKDDRGGKFEVATESERSDADVGQCLQA